MYVLILFKILVCFCFHTSHTSEILLYPSMHSFAITVQHLNLCTLVVYSLWETFIISDG